MGQIPSNFYYIQKRGRKMFISCHVWCLKDEYYNWEEQLNKDELVDSRWVPFE